ncbi:VWA domain-containing protein [Pontibacter sp. G13]|uniref:vWA domain-containing protein n=1 Tax=Pontibacter sp. G13 TaxID=3074898 RepID=UPI00288AD8BD|nr:VWA domain-containing protein [Pontibacter sp. G13]WNJ17362.1 VWA domain-containing protein [Pontibacter sp. G13]
METFEWGYPWAFACLPLPLLVWAFMPPVLHRRSALRAPVMERLEELTGRQAKDGVRIARKGWVRSLALWLIWVALITALASPQLVGEPEKQVKEARNFLIAADISFSMDTRDWVVDGKRMSRWQGVKSVLADFIQKREGDRMGLVFFGSQAYMQAPFTPDLDLIHSLLDETEVGMAGQQTVIGNAIGMAIRMFESDTTRQRVVVLLTDGVDSGSDVTPLDAAYSAKQDSIVIYTIGIGDPATRGSDLDERTLQSMAETTGGKYFRAIDQQKLQEIYEILDELEPIEYEAEAYQPKQLLYSYPLAVALALALIVTLISTVWNLLKPNPRTDE